MDISRRAFVKATAVALASAAAAGSLASMTGCAGGGSGSTGAASGGEGQKHTAVCRFCGCGCGVIVEAKDGKVIAANMWGKVKTVLQMLTIIFYYFSVSLTGNVLGADCAFVAHWLCWLVAVVTAVSGIKYLWDNRSFINTAK